MANDKYTDAIQRSFIEATPAYLNRQGEFIAGKVVDRYIATGDYGAYPVLEIEAVHGTFGLEVDGEATQANEKEVYAIHAFRQIAKQEVEQRDIRVGQEIVFTCNGQRPSKVKGRNDMFLYKIVIVSQGEQEEAPF
jgi:hypothetical protein